MCNLDAKKEEAIKQSQIEENATKQLAKNSPKKNMSLKTKNNCPRLKETKVIQQLNVMPNP